MAKVPKLYRKRKGKNGPYVGNWICKVNRDEVNLGTKVLDGEHGANARVLLAMKGRRDFKSDADRVVEQMEKPPAAPAPAIGEGKQTSHDPPELEPAKGTIVPNPAPAPEQPPIPLRLVAPPADASAEAAATAAAAEETAGGAGDADAGAGATDETPPSAEELAGLAVEAQIWVAAEYARSKVYRGFSTPELQDEGKKRLAAQWEKIINYSGTATVLPPWVTGALIPGAILLTATFSMARAFADLAREQKQQAAEKPSGSMPSAAAA